MWVFLAVFAITLLIGYKWLHSHYNYWKEKHVPHPPTNMFFGNITEALQMKKSLGQVYADIYNKYPDLLYVGSYRIRTPALVIRDLELLKTIMVKNFNSFHDNDVDIDEKVDPMFAKNPFAIKGERWKTVRNQITPCFTSGKIKSLFHIMQEVCQKFIQCIERESKSAGEVGIETKELSARFTTENVISCAFGLEANCFKNDKSVYREMGRKMMHPGLLQGIKILIVMIIPTFANYFRIKFVQDEVANYFRNLVNEILKYRQENNIKRNDFIDNLLEIKAKDATFNNEDLTAHSLGLFTDGYETSSVMMSFTLYEIASNLHVQQKLKNEIDQVLAKGKPTYEAVQEMAYLDAVICESLRKYPPGMFLMKRCTEQFTLPPPKPNSPPVTIPPQTPIMIPLYGIHNDTKYFKDPKKFDPERFLGERKNEIVKFSYMPFGEGPRACLGQRFALMQVKVAIFSVVSNFELRVSNKTLQPLQLDPNYFMIAAKGGLWVKYYKRK